MSKVLSHTPTWLSRPAPGFQVFQPADKPKTTGSLGNGQEKKVEVSGPTRTLAHRGTEIIFVVDNEIRWADLLSLKDGQDGTSSPALEGHSPYRVLKAPVAGQIRQLTLSPLGDYLAITTSHTVHVAVLPSTLDMDSSAPIRLKTFQLGPTAHVLEQAPVASVLWHPLGALGTCLVTVATDACVRLWELNTDSRQSFDTPTLALDLKKLANAASYGEDLRASVYGTSKGFSPDQVEMEVAAATFGGIGTPDELGWSAMTLWIVMTEGDVYALCPLIPSTWQPSVSTIPSLSTSVVSKAAILDQDDEVPEAEKRQAAQQQKWLSDLDAQDPTLEVLPKGLDTVEIYSRPTHPPAVPKLQGPLRLGRQRDFGVISDVIAIAPRLDDESVMDGGEDEYGEETARPGLSIGILCLVTRSGEVHICLDIKGVEAMWLPTRRSPFATPEADDVTELVLLETVRLKVDDTDNWPSLTPSLSDRYSAENPLYEQQRNASYSFLATTDVGVYTLDLSSWTQNLEDELSGPSDAGTAFRMGILYSSDRTLTSIVTCFSHASVTSAATTFIDSDLGLFVLTMSGNQPYAATLEAPLRSPLLDALAPDAPLLLSGPEAREVYQPDAEFFAKSQLSSYIDQLLHSGSTRLQRTDLTAPLRLSPATLQLLTEAHRVLSEETNRLGLAAADLFRRCQRMQAELAEQVRRVREARERADGVTRDEQGGSNVEKIGRRMAAVREKEGKLQERIESVKRKVAGLGGESELSSKEVAWAGEVRGVEERMESELGKRLQDVKALMEDLVDKAEEVRQVRSREGDERGETRQGAGGVSSEIKRKKLDQVMALLERETALVDAVSQRLSRLAESAGR